MKLNNASLSDCIKVYSNIFSSDWCEDLITYFENSLYVRTDDHRKQSNEMQLIGDPRPDAIDYKKLTDIYNTGFRSLQIQRYTPEDKGYSAVHVESGQEHYKKYLAVIVYLNDVEGGETIFSMGDTSITPKTGSVAIWPAGLPFYHCGLKSKTTKYILTTWFEFM